MGMLDWLIKKIFTKQTHSTWRDAIPMKDSYAMADSLRKELSRNGKEKKIINYVLLEFNMLHPECQIKESIVKDIILESL